MVKNLLPRDPRRQSLTVFDDSLVSSDGDRELVDMEPRIAALAGVVQGLRGVSMVECVLSS